MNHNACLCLIIADSNIWQQGEKGEKPKATEFYLTDEKIYIYYKWLFLYMDGVNWRLFCIFL